MIENHTLMRINKLLELKQWTIYKLAKESDIPYSSLNNLFQRNTEPTLPTLRKICNGLNISLSEFFSDEEITERFEYTKEELAAIDMLRSLNKRDHKLALDFLKLLTQK